jgi:hypothetical protein
MILPLILILLGLSRNQPLQKLFSPLQEGSSKRSYANVLARFLCMVLRSLENDMGYKPLTDGQKGLAEGLMAALGNNTGSSSSSSPAAADILQRFFHPLCVALFCRVNYGGGRSEDGMEECPVYRFLVFTSLRGSGCGGGFRPTSSVTPICARLEFSIRLVVYHEMFQQMEKDNQLREQWEEDVPAMAADNTRLWEDRIKQREQLLKFVHANECTPFAAIHDIHQLAKAVAGSSGSSVLPRIIWTPQTNFTSLSIDSTLVTLDGLRTLVQNLLGEAKRFLATEVLLGQRLEEMDELVRQRLVDKYREDTPGYSFLDDPTNKLHERYGRCLLQAFITSPSIGNKFVTTTTTSRSSSSSRGAIIGGGGGGIEYNKDACHAWLTNTGKFLDMLTALIHIGGGQPARAEELATLRIRNTRYTYRGVFYIYDTIMLCTMYHKGRNITGSNKVIPRFLPKSVATLLLQYLVIVRPVEV